jgi:hypothetical protein
MELIHILCFMILSILLELHISLTNLLMIKIFFLHLDGGTPNCFLFFFYFNVISIPFSDSCIIHVGILFVATPKMVIQLYFDSRESPGKAVTDY